MNRFEFRPATSKDYWRVLRDAIVAFQKCLDEALDERP